MTIVAALHTAMSHISMTDYRLLHDMAARELNNDYPSFRVHDSDDVIVFSVTWALAERSLPVVRDEIRLRLEEGFSHHFCELVLFAAERNCWLVQLDIDADPEDELTTFDGNEFVEQFLTPNLTRIITDEPPGTANTNGH